MVFTALPCVDHVFGTSTTPDTLYKKLAEPIVEGSWRVSMVSPVVLEYTAQEVLHCLAACNLRSLS